ncbi:SpoIIE family protein phosphatase [candidate division KSB1 bacterium]|nr:SpoIIE family protein phosphatase [candidate division KSB1 bacterium]NIR71905.1 SpoIIE family protein phosphatase [candidate division KSB1 bacterium]NIS23795.1 SpoIIE family protein phosphatase [candidate division KSB1 bacterium]NIT70718.1 SpoIIE family protein phosphatase [candidate division KSB1 bacterium]NIU24445.1 SpoIIE family protein phosphatase [candidate division KSB1 bacterium]
MALRKKYQEEDFVKLQQENARLKKSIEDLWNINQLARIISSTMPVNKILDKVVSVSVKAINAEQGTISLLEKKESDDPFKTLVRKVDRSTIKDKYRLDEDLSGWMIKNRKALRINNFKEDDTFKGQHAKIPEIRSILSVPLLCKGKLIGVINLFNKKDDGKFSNDDQRLLSIIASQSAQVIENARLYEEEKHLRQIEQELATARSIQIELLPDEGPNVEGFDIAGVSHPAKEVGGDYFDFIKLDEDRWGIALGDISGKGIPAALLMSSLQATLRSQALTTTSIVDCISKTNNILYLNTASNKFVTLFFGLLEGKKGRFSYVNAGHNFPFLFDKSGGFQSLETGGMVLGILPECKFEKNDVGLKPGEIIIIYSDGVTEAENEQEEQFGEERLRDIVWKYSNLSSKQIMDKIYAEVSGFAGPKKQDDDVTLVIIKAV